MGALAGNLVEGKDYPYRWAFPRFRRGLLIKSTLTTKSQTTIPKPVRSALRLKPGDEIAYEIIEGRKVVLTRAGGEPAEDPFATFSEWDGQADRKAYADL